MVFLNNYKPKLSYILAKLSSKCLKESYFPDCWKDSSVVPAFTNVEEKTTAKNYCPVSLLSMVSKVFQKLVKNWIVDHLEKCGLFSLTGLGLLDLWHLIYQRLLTEFGMLVFLANLSLMEFQVRYLALFLFFSVIDDFK